MRTRKEREIYIGKFELSFLLTKAFESFSGFLLSTISISGLYPFGLGYVSFANSAGLLGAIIGYSVFCPDAYRYLFACIFSFLLRKLFSKRIPINGVISSFFFIIWGTLLSEILGIITAKYTFSENVLFAISGIIGGACGVIYCLANNQDESISLHRKNVVFFCRGIFIASIFSGMAFLGEFAVTGAYILALFTVFAFGRYAGLMRCFALGLLINIFYLLTGLFSWIMLGSLLICSVVSGFMHDLPRYFPVATCFVSALLMLIYTQGTFISWVNILCVLISGILCVILPSNVIDNYCAELLPRKTKTVVGGSKFKIRKKNVKKSDTATSDMNPVCTNCNRKMICWVRDHDYTSDMFLKLRSSNFTHIPSHFEEHCDRICELLNVLKGPQNKDTCSKILVSKGAVTKRGEKKSGDTVAIFSTKESRQIFCLIDGMGSGPLASAQSVEGAGILRKLIENGVDKKEAVHFLNEQLSEKKHELIMGIDIMVIDIDGGYIDTCKAGVSPTYIVRNRKIYEFGASCLPIGVLETAQPETARCRIHPGDIIVMVSDGFEEQGGEWVGHKLSEYALNENISCNDISENLLEDACESGLDVYDDLTVIAVKIL